ncbi:MULTISPECIES: DUF4139 domain-containing protein [unclassified Variovorax]|jgi:uncharacterized protein (TIGR02231 family)|uniref:DUF4139 domain-containing protein n=1 Tax=unclassified Variovorax TaxID=663243 RepID=UPI000F7DBCD6|nr:MULTISPECIES: DUF4139 domain-containing protein [unclassified Variovorax]RSZ36176.1 mucoidy inhibitor MuiA family protein [Variovorax sp. 553]RSZ36666.1 mucoidy inhibitor MuiA family protein [Variovorax sp. 679]
MKASTSALLRATAGAAVLLVLSLSAQGQAATPQAVAADSRITQVKVYPGSATVERVARVAAGARSVTFACLPAGLDVQSLQVSADASVRIGETSVLTEQRELSARCSTSPLDGRIRELEDQKAALQAENDALGMVTGYLKGLAGGSGNDAPGARAPMDARNLAAMTDAMRRTGQDSLLKQHQIQRRQTEIDRQLNPLLAERTRTQGNGGQVTAVTVTLAAGADADVKLSYQVNGPGWTPTYRALLDTTTRKVRIERQALVAQATGEDWRGVKLVLSTGQPRRETTGRLPGAWRIGIEPPPRPAAEMAYPAAPAAAMAPSPIMASKSMDSRERRAEPLFDVSVFDNSFATEFSVPQAIDVPSNGQRVTMALGQHEDTAKLAARTSPRVDASAFLVAELDQPAGVWPAGPMQLYRDGAFVGSGRWNAPSDTRLTLSFGRDELVRVQAEPERDNQGTGGFAGSRAERKVQRAYVVENRHRTSIAVQVLEAAPVSVDEKVRVASEFSPQPAELAWNKQPGLAMWQLDLAAGQTARVTADYTIGYPKDARLQMR